MIKKIRTELILLAIIASYISISYNLDLSLYKYFKEIHTSFGGVYLKKFFIDITDLGDSFWYFLIFIFIFIISYFLNKSLYKNSKKLLSLKSFSLSAIVYLLATGILTQLIKHLVGRARPNHTNLDSNFVFDFFTTNSSFHSFPSGHASTAFIISLIFASVFPKVKYLFYFFGLIVGFSRVVVGAHFITDVIAGFLIAIITFKLLNNFFEKKFSSVALKSFEITRVNIIYYILLSLGVACLILTVGPTIDLFFSGLFYFGNKNFLLQSYYPITIFFREILLPIVLVYLLFLPIISKFLGINKLFFNYVFTTKNILFLWVSTFSILVLFINLFLKNLWGRVRPGDTMQLGGKDVFTPWYQFSDSCLSNCSFVSGDSAVGFSLVVLYFFTKKTFYVYMSVLIGFLLGFVRIAEGGHFLSDVVFSGFFVILLFFIFYSLYSSKYE